MAVHRASILGYISQQNTAEYSVQEQFIRPNLLNSRTVLNLLNLRAILMA